MSQDFFIWWMTGLTVFVSAGATINVIMARRNVRNARINLMLADQCNHMIAALRAHLGMDKQATAPPGTH